MTPDQQKRQALISAATTARRFADAVLAEAVGAGTAREREESLDALYIALDNYSILDGDAPSWMRPVSTGEKS